MPSRNVVPFPIPETEARREPDPRKKQDIGYLLGYWIGLFSIAALLILLSWFSAQQRRSAAAIDEAQEQHAAFSASAMENILFLQQENEQLRQQVHADAGTISSLLEEIEALQSRLDGK